MKILMAVGSFYPETTGGATHIADLIDNLKGRYNFFVICGVGNSLLFPHISIYNGAAVYRMKIEVGNLFQRLLSIVKVAIGYMKFGYQCDILHMHGFTQMNLTLALLAKITGKRVIYTAHTAGHDDPVSIINSSLGKFKKILFLLFDRIICVSPGLYGLWKANGNLDKKAIFIPNGINTARYRPVKDEYEKSNLRQVLGLASLNYKIIVYVGYMKKDKGFHLLLDAWLRLKDEFPFVKIIAISPLSGNIFEKDYYKGIKEFIKENMLQEDIRFIERTFEIEKYFKASDIFVLPSYKEGMPIVLLETMASGLCCLASRLAGSTDFLIENGINGFLFETGDSEDLADKLRTILKDDNLIKRIGINSRNYASQRYNITELSARYIDIYNSL